MTGMEHNSGALPDVDIAGLTADSRTVEPGYLFAALPSSAADGRAFIADALARGAAVVLAPTGTGWPPPGDAPHDAALLTADNPRRVLAKLAARFSARQPRTIGAVTGTNGKTSVVTFARQIWQALGHSAASMGTLGLDAPGFAPGASLTTPDPVALHRQLAALADAGVDHLAIEASSHGLDQCRLDGVELTAAVFTNLSRDHLDYHRDMAGYLAAKQRLFATLLPAGATAVLNADAPEFAQLARICRNAGQRILGYGRAGAELRLDAQTPTAAGQRLRLTAAGTPHTVTLPLVGGFQAHNALAALGLVIAAADDVDRAAAIAALSGLSGVRGRLERIAGHPAGAAIFVDYAHTPDALETVLRAVRPHVGGRLVVVFGAGGDRDPGKRPLMGAVCARLADRAIVTDDNPRTEDAATIRAAIMAACPGATEIGDRAAAIDAGIDTLAADDALIVAGKGHEPGQIVGDRVLDFDDATVARAAIRARGGQP